jgi:hypothetical protein
MMMGDVIQTTLHTMNQHQRNPVTISKEREVMGVLRHRKQTKKGN